MPIRGSNPRITAQQQTGATVGKPSNRGRAKHQLAGGSHARQPPFGPRARQGAPRKLGVFATKLEAAICYAERLVESALGPA